MIFSVRRPQYFISHTKSQQLNVTRHRLSFTQHACKVGLGRPWAYLPNGLESMQVIL